MKPPTTPPDPKITCGTCAHHDATYMPAYASPTHRSHCRHTCDISRNTVSPYMTACPLYERQITPIAPT